MQSIPRVIPCLLMREGALYKTTRFSDPVYVGDPINAIRVFNDKEVDELALLDIGTGKDQQQINFDLIAEVATECFMPLAYGGGVRSMNAMRRLYALGLEKVSVNTAAVEDPQLVSTAAAEFGNQSVVVSIDVRRDRRGRANVVTHGGTKKTGLRAVEHARRVEELGAGEIFLTAIDREGTGTGFDTELVEEVAAAVHIPVIAHGGAGTLQDLVTAFGAGASAVAAGTMFTFHGKHRAVLISYPTVEERLTLVDDR